MTWSKELGHIHVCVIQTDLLNYIVKSLNLDCVPALTNVNVSKLSWNLEDMAFIASNYYTRFPIMPEKT